MDEHKTGGLKVWIPLFFSIVLILGMILGFNLRDSLRNKRDLQTIIERNDRLEEIIDLVKDKYVDTVNTNVLYADAVNGILGHLDPHTTYIPADEVQSANESLEGGFYGIGIEFSIVRDTIQVISVINGGPAEHAGIDIGDQLIKVGDTVVAGKEITSDHIIHMLKGKQHTNVFLTLKRSVSGDLVHATINRDVVPINSIDADLMLDANTGYIKIDRFSANTYTDFVTALQRLKKNGMRQLVIDLRDNPGGYLDAATQIADELLGDNKLIVYTQGRNAVKQEYKASAEGLFEKGKVILLVDESSASASEILAGAVQDWDRGVIIGRRTFGKGLVQEQYEMEDGAALRLTVAKYYTPSGRCIQRTYANGKEAYEKDFEKRFEDGELTIKDTIAITDTTKYYTGNHRVVYGGGGIKPDVYVPYDTSHFSTGLLSMIFSDGLKNVVWDYFIRNRNNLKFNSIDDYLQRFNGTDEIVNKYLISLNAKEKAVATQVLARPSGDAYFRSYIKAQIARFLFSNNGYYAILSKGDNAIQKALEVLHSDAYSKIISR